MNNPPATDIGPGDTPPAPAGARRLAIMQPYLFPYLGYFQLMHAVDTFILYDDATYINRGWINRNRLLVQGAPWLFTLPLRNASQNTLIRDLLIADHLPKWRAQWLATLRHAYHRAPHYATVRALIEPLLQTPSRWLIDWLHGSLQALADALDLTVAIRRGSGDPLPRAADDDAQSRILARCAREGASLYLNPIDGRALYRQEAFAARGIQLGFLQSTTPPYAQGGVPFVPRLSIIDTLMFAGLDGTRALLGHYRLIADDTADTA